MPTSAELDLKENDVVVLVDAVVGETAYELPLKPDATWANAAKIYREDDIPVRYRARLAKVRGVEPSRTKLKILAASDELPGVPGVGEKDEIGSAYDRVYRPVDDPLDPERQFLDLGDIGVRVEFGKKKVAGRKGPNEKRTARLTQPPVTLGRAPSGPREIT